LGVTKEKNVIKELRRKLKLNDNVYVKQRKNSNIIEIMTKVAGGTRSNNNGKNNLNNTKKCGGCNNNNCKSCKREFEKMHGTRQMQLDEKKMSRKRSRDLGGYIPPESYRKKKMKKNYESIEEYPIKMKKLWKEEAERTIFGQEHKKTQTWYKVAKMIETKSQTKSPTKSPEKSPTKLQTRTQPTAPLPPTTAPTKLQTKPTKSKTK